MVDRRQRNNRTAVTPAHKQKIRSSWFSASRLPALSESGVFQLYKVVLAPPAAFCLEGLWAGLVLAMVTEYGFSHRKWVIMQERCYENEEIKLQVHLRAVAALSHFFFFSCDGQPLPVLSFGLFFFSFPLVPIIPSIAIIMYESLDKFSAFIENSITVTLSQSAVRSNWFELWLLLQYEWSLWLYIELLER